jgi:hypothetical protein
MLSMNHYTDAEGLTCFGDRASDLVSQPLLNLKTPREHFGDSGNFRKS